MFLKSIEVQGFKSFANKLTFQFHKGITGIVGPNGSGKSNVADAVRWVLGEQSAKQLRGSKMEDVIFSGTENRKALGFAYVAITLDNSDHQLPIEYDDVTISRRVYRSGDSEYKINGHTCRLKDIQELFFDTGIGKEGYSIIGQGQIDKILSGKPDDRRELFDEAAGIVKYKKRRTLTEKNLEVEQQNLSRIKDILYELEKQVGPLAKQSETAKLFLEYRDELKKLDAKNYLLSFEQIKKDGARFEEALAIATTQLNDTEKKLWALKTEYADIEALVEACDIRIQEIQTLWQDKAIEKEKLDGSINLIETKKNTLSSKLVELKGELENLYAQLTAKEKEIDGLTAENDILESKRVELDETKGFSEGQLTTMTENIARIKKNIDDRNADIIEYLNEAAMLKGSIQRYTAMEETAQIHLAELNSRLISISSEAQKEDDLSQAFKKEAQMIGADIRQIENRKLETEKKMTLAKEDLLKKQSELKNREREFHEASAKYQTLKNVIDRYDGYGNSIRQIMARKDHTPGIIGVVADILHVEKSYEVAIETALGGSISNIVTKDAETAREMIEFLKKNKFGRATFLPLTDIKGKQIEQKRQLENETGVIGIASKLVEADKEFANLVEYLLGRIVIVDEFDHALALARKYKHSLRIVTLDGESLSPGGSISGGAYKNTGNLLARHREMEELKTGIKNMQDGISFLNKRTGEIAAKIKEYESILDEANGELETLHIRENTVGLRLKHISDSKENHEDAIAAIEKEIREVKRQILELAEMKEDLADQIGDYETKQKAAQAAIDSLNQHLDGVQQQEKLFHEETADMRIQYAAIEQKQQFITENVVRLTEEIFKIKQSIDQISKQILDAEAEYASEDEELKLLHSQLEAVVIELDESKAALDSVKAEKEFHAGKQKGFFTQREELSDISLSLDREINRLNSQKDKIEEKRQELGNYMWEEYSMTLQMAREYAGDSFEDLSLNQIKRQSTELKNKIKDLGPVNINAIEEYKVVAERYETMKKQHDDMVNAEEKLTHIIESLNKSMEKQFREKFAAIQVEFDKVFKLLFGGGFGTLSLADPENLLETGIIITAQPPGKKLQNMMQLSGGEKALTAIALLFAIQSLKPSPFCLLDEIEAALDDANVKRFAEYLHNLTEATQFIVITHRRGTMNAADSLYGITMQEKGISTLVSVNLIENELTK